MKTTIVAILFVLATGQANAEGFYQRVIGDHSPQAISGKATEFTYTPLYKQVAGNPQEYAGQGQTASTRDDFTPLYAKVMGRAG
ncbi:MAG: hypothetical protein ACE5GZ_02570 [Gammaproteobacteria bacterium]